jgi:proteasome subunit B (beta)-like protein
MSLIATLPGNDGLLIASDSRAFTEATNFSTMADNCQKIFEITKHCGLGVAGLEGLGVYLIDRLRSELRRVNTKDDVDAVLRVSAKVLKEHFGGERILKELPFLSFLLIGYKQDKDRLLGCAYSLDSSNGFEPRMHLKGFGCIGVFWYDFYEPFAEWLKNDLDEVTDVASLGGASMKTKWGTPDVIGVYKPLAGNLIKFPLEIVSVEIKIDPQAPVVAFGQAMAYRLFSAKTYVAMPTTLSEEDQSRLESLAMLFGIGLVLFDVDKDNPRFSIRVRAQRFSPDMFYVNEFAERLKFHDAQIFELLFR